jgi:hypothetical protein
MNHQPTDNSLQEQPPWYRQFWPWFLIGLPLCVVIAGFNMLYIALKYPHSMVDDQYYKEGLAINQSLDQDRRAAELNVAAEIVFQPFGGTETAYVVVSLSGLANYPERLSLLLLHPGSQSLDQTLDLKQIEAEQYSARLTQQYQHSYYLRLQPVDKSWRLNGKINFQNGGGTALSPITAMSELKALSPITALSESKALSELKALSAEKALSESKALSDLKAPNLK